jgi:hypothetical protein
MPNSYSTRGEPTLNLLRNVNITDVSNNDFLQYNSTNGVWENRANRPYFMKARVNTDYSISSTANPILMTEDNLGGNNYNSGDFSVDTWTCPQTGIYRVSTSLTASATTADELRQLTNLTNLYTNAGVLIREISEAVSFAGHDDASEFYEASIPAKSIEHINIGEKVRLYTYYVIGGGSGITIKGRTNASRTYMIIERII